MGAWRRKPQRAAQEPSQHLAPNKPNDDSNHDEDEIVISKRKTKKIVVPPPWWEALGLFACPGHQPVVSLYTYTNTTLDVLHIYPIPQLQLSIEQCPDLTNL